MFDRFLMYWLLWLLFIVIFFFMKEGKKRFVLTAWLLLMISFSSIYVEIGSMQVSIAMMIVLMGALIYIVERSFSFMQLLRALMIMTLYCVLLIWKLVAPVWFFLPEYFMIPILTVLAAVFLCGKLDAAEPYILLGVTLGQLLFDLLLSVYQLHHEIGMTIFFIHLSLTVLMFITIRACFMFWGHMSKRLTRNWI